MDKNTQIEIAEYLNGTCKSEHDAADKFNCTVDEVYEACNENEIERCEVCEWWCEASELDATACLEFVCADCME